MKRLALMCVVLFTLVAQVGHTQQRDFSFAVAEKFRAQMDVTFLQAGVGDINSFQIGLNPRAGSDRLGVPTPGIGFGYAVGNNLQVGGRIKLGFSSTEEDFGLAVLEMKVFDWQFLPYGEYLFLDGALRPFVAAQMGVGGTKLSGDIADQHTVQFIVSGGGGVHYFLAPGFSFDALMLFGGHVGSTDVETGVSNFTTSIDATYFLFEMLVGISGWFSLWP